jgi:drug/metabolite transporter (DMT)-like permease
MTGIGTTSLLSALIISFFEANLLFNRTAALLGMCGGFCLYLAVFCYFHLLKGGARLGISWTIVTLSMMIPTAGSIVLWHEVPGALGWLSLLLTVASIVVLGKFKKRGSPMGRRDVLYLSAAFLFSGVGALIAKAIVALNLEQHRNIYFLFVFATMLLISLCVNVITRRPPLRKELFSGGAMGIAGMGNFWFIVRALRDIPGTVAFPFRTCGSILLTVMVSRIVWRERIKPQEIVGIVLAMIAIALMNL